MGVALFLEKQGDARMAHHQRSFLLTSNKQPQGGGELHHLNLLPLSTPHVQSSIRKQNYTLHRLLILLLLFISVLLLVLRIPIPSLSNNCPSDSAAQNVCSTPYAICCDRSAFRTDVCMLNGDIRTQSSSFTFLIISNSSSPSPVTEERIRPYTRKWEAPVMSTIDELRLLPRNSSLFSPACDVRHNVPAVVFSTGGYTGNVYHEVNDGLIPLYLTSRRFRRQVVFVILEYHDWWISKYSDFLAHLSDHHPINFSADNRTHCFSHAVVGLQIHDELSIDASRADHGESVADFHRILDDVYRPRVNSILEEEGSHRDPASVRPKLVIISRNGSRAIENERELVAVAEEVGFRVEVLRPDKRTEMAKIYMALNSSDAMVGVHGAAMTHLLFMRPGAVFIQIVPLGLQWAAEEYYGRPAVKAGLRYESYRILARESSLSRSYGKDDPVLRSPDRVNAKGWEETKKVYLDGQTVRLDLARFRKRLARARRYLASTSRRLLLGSSERN